MDGIPRLSQLLARRTPAADGVPRLSQLLPAADSAPRQLQLFRLQSSAAAGVPFVGGSSDRGLSAGRPTACARFSASSGDATNHGDGRPERHQAPWRRFPGGGGRILGPNCGVLARGR